MQRYNKMSEYANYMTRCLQLARMGEYYVAPNPMVGALLFDAEGKIIAEGWHEQFGGPHAEVNCFAHAEQRGYRDFREMTLVVSLEPCNHYGKTPPCTELILRHRPRRVVVGSLDPNPLVAGQGVARLREAGIEVVTDVLRDECRELNKRFFMLHEHHRPYVILKWAQTADGFLDRVRQSKDEPVLRISTAVTKRIVHKMRAENMAIMVGTRTALLDNPALLNTHWAGRNPIRVVLDRKHVLPPDARIFSGDAETIVYSDNTEWDFVLRDLAERGIHSLLVEGGATLLETILRSGVYDEVHVEVAPEMTIGEGVPAPRIALRGMPQQIDGRLLYEWREEHGEA